MSPAWAAPRPAQKRSSCDVGRELGRLQVEGRGLVVAALADELVRPPGERVGLVQAPQAASSASGSGWSSTRSAIDRVPAVAVGRHDQDRRRLASADVAALGLGRVERRQQAPVSGPPLAVNASSIAGQTRSEAMMFA